MVKLVRKDKNGLLYYPSNQTIEPSLLVISGLHGDEYKIIDLVKQSLEENKELPGFLFVPEASPSAVKKRTRLNQEGVDLNRSFFRKTTVNEAKAITELVRPFKFDVCVSFHEDVEQTDFYLYDSGDLKNSQIWSSFKRQLCELGVELLNGIDDPVLMNRFRDGYRSFPPEANGRYKEDGTFWAWVINEGIAKRFLNPEIPSKIPQNKKRAIINIFLDQIIVPLCKKTQNLQTRAPFKLLSAE